MKTLLERGEDLLRFYAQTTNSMKQPEMAFFFFLMSEYFTFYLFPLDTEAWANPISICNLCDIELQKREGLFRAQLNGLPIARKK